MHENAKQRQAILENLYRVREAKAGLLKPCWFSEYDLKNAHGNCAFALDVLTEIGHIKRDGPRYQITGQGVLACEAGIDSSNG